MLELAVLCTEWGNWHDESDTDVSGTLITVDSTELTVSTQNTVDSTQNTVDSTQLTVTELTFDSALPSPIEMITIFWCSEWEKCTANVRRMSEMSECLCPGKLRD